VINATGIKAHPLFAHVRFLLQQIMRSSEQAQSLGTAIQSLQQGKSSIVLRELLQFDQLILKLFGL
jgi:hypothetical protein